MEIRSMYFFERGFSASKHLIIRIEGEKKEVLGAMVGVMLGDEIPEELRAEFKVWRVEFTASGKSRRTSIGEISFSIDDLWGAFEKNKDSLNYIVVYNGKMLSPRKISIPGEWLD